MRCPTHAAGQTLHDPSGKLVMEARVASSQHSVAMDDDNTIQAHLTDHRR